MSTDETTTLGWRHHTAADPEPTLRRFGVDRERGVSSADAARRRAAVGPNALRVDDIRGWQVLVRQFRSAFIYLLVAAAVLAIALGEGIDGLMILIFVGINAALGFVQEFRSEQTLKLLRSRTVRRARVRRDGTVFLIPSEELVPGDIVIVESGDIIPADLRFFKTHDVTVDETSLTGESAPVAKTGNTLPAVAADVAAAHNIGFSGTTVVGGEGEGVVIATGRQTMIGDVNRLTVETVRVSAFEKNVQRFSTFILRLIGSTLLVVFLANLLWQRGGTSPVELIIFSIALAVSVIPEAMPLVTTFSLSRGAHRLAKQHVLVKRLSSIEDLGSIEVLCTDKTGTLTENHLTVRDVRPVGNAQPTLLAGYAATLSKADREPNNAFDVALWAQLTPEQKQHIQSAPRINELPFDPERRRNSVLVRLDGKPTLIVRGAPEEIMSAVDSSDAERTAFKRWVADVGRRGHRALAVAHKTIDGDTYTAADEQAGLQFDGCIAFEDPIKPTTESTVRQAHQLGVSVKILTGDSPEVAGAVAAEVGIIDSPEAVLTGADFEALPAVQQHRAVKDYQVFARVSPQQKFRIIQLLEEQQRVGFLGEGINDAPALKIANVGLVVDHAADIARESADIILLKKNLRTIVDGIREGRSVFANTSKYITITLASNFGNFFAIAIASFLIDFLPMLPLQLLLLNLLSDFPMIAIATDTVDHNELVKPKSIDIREIALVATILGCVSTLFDFLLFGIFFREGPQILHTNWFIGSTLTELALLFSLRSKGPLWRAKRPSTILVVLTAVGILASLTIPLIPRGAALFHFVRPTTADALLIIGIVLVYLVATEWVKLLYYRLLGRRETNGVTAT